jgi:S-adenosylmethionine:tRNA ribosyltransferase-isomerase
MDVSQLDYALPEELIAQSPLPERDAARLLCVARSGTALTHRSVRELPELIPPSLLVLNDTRVIPARLFAHKPSGGRVEFLLVERLGGDSTRQRWLALARTRRGLRRDMQLHSAELSVTVLALRGRGEVEVELVAEQGVSEALARVGQVP